MCEGYLANGKNCNYKAKYSTNTNRVLCGIHLKTEKIVNYEVLSVSKSIKVIPKTTHRRNKKLSIIEIIDTFDIFCLPNEIICHIVDCCDFRSQILFSLSNEETRVMFPKLAQHTTKSIRLHIASTYKDINLLLRDTKLFNINIKHYSEFCKLAIINTPSFNVASYFMKLENIRHITMINICENKNVEIGTKIIDNHKELSYAFLRKSITCENLHYVSFILDNNTFNSLDALVCEVASKGNLSSLILLLEKGGVVYSGRITDCFVIRGYLDCLIYFNENGYILDSSCLLTAAIGGKLNCVKYIFENILPRYTQNVENCPICLVAYLAAFKFKHLDCIKYFHENGLLHLKQFVGQN